MDPYYEGTWEAFGVAFTDADGNATPYQASGTVDCQGSYVKVDVSTDNGAIVFTGLVVHADENPGDGNGYNLLATDWEEFPTALYGWGTSEYGTIILLDSLDPNAVQNQLALYFE